MGFRPFVYRLAEALGLAGEVRNAGGGVELEVEGAARALERFVARLSSDAPAAARVDRLEVASLPPRGARGFHIAASDERSPVSVQAPPDLAPCAACLAELRDPADRRHGYPFTSCTACGPRLTVVTALPYDRARTTMARFPLCAACAAEYADPASRRFHAETIACAACGPSLQVERAGEAAIDFPVAAQVTADAASDAPVAAAVTNAAAIEAAVAALRSGGIVAMKGVGGYHLVCDARRGDAVARLRARKRREAKPFAVCVSDVAETRRRAQVSPDEAAALESQARPIVLLRRLPDDGLAPAVAPGLDRVGYLLPPSPLHQRLAERMGAPLVMTSGNLGDEPIATTRAAARASLRAVAELFLHHDREIAARADDSLLRVDEGVPRVLRRARGLTPDAVALPSPCSILAVGGDLKSTFCLLQEGAAHVSQHLGDLAHPDARAAFRETLFSSSLQLGFRPAVVACDLHPDYASTRLAESLGLPLERVQHHHAHVAACLAEHGVDGPVVGVAFDGAGHGLDGALWGGEFLVGDRRAMSRAAHLRYVRLPGGDRAAREPWRMALAYLDDAAQPLDACNAPPTRIDDVAALASAMRKGLGSPPTSSAGRLFDAVAALLGVRSVGQYEGQAAMELEALCRTAALADDAPAYPYALVHARRDAAVDLAENPEKTGPAIEIDLRPSVAAMCADRRRGVAAATIGARFHVTVAAMLTDVVCQIATVNRLSRVVLTGGCFQNATLARLAEDRLRAAGLAVLRPSRFPPNDGGLSLGQAAVAAARRSG